MKKDPFLSVLKLRLLYWMIRIQGTFTAQEVILRSGVLNTFSSASARSAVSIIYDSLDRRYFTREKRGGLYRYKYHGSSRSKAKARRLYEAFFGSLPSKYREGPIPRKPKLSRTESARNHCRGKSAAYSIIRLMIYERNWWQPEELKRKLSQILNRTMVTNDNLDKLFDRILNFLLSNEILIKEISEDRKIKYYRPADNVVSITGKVIELRDRYRASRKLAKQELNSFETITGRISHSTPNLREVQRALETKAELAVVLRLVLQAIMLSPIDKELLIREIQKTLKI